MSDTLAYHFQAAKRAAEKRKQLEQRIAKLEQFVAAYDEWDDADGCTWPIDAWETLAAAREALEDDNG